MSRNAIKPPRFAVVGHPNKGKSSIVAALTQNEDVAISPLPGTTRHARTYRLVVDDTILLELIDTPGFQRAREVLEWLQNHEDNALNHPVSIQRFIETFKENPRFNDEIEILSPIIEKNAGIIYVVDASKPYTPQFESEMEILRRCMQPSMAIINRIGKGDYSDEWRRALRGYFNIVRTYNPLEARLKEHIHLLESLSHVDETWSPSIEAAARQLQVDFDQKIAQSAHIISQTVIDILSYTRQIPIKAKRADNEEKKRLVELYKKTLEDMEIDAVEKLKRLWRHERLGVDTGSLHVTQANLFSKESASIFGLDKKDLILAGALGGAVSGANIDLLFFGHTFFTGGIIGGALGAVGVYLSFDHLAQIEVLGMRAGRYRLQIGPIKDPNFPYILTGRLLYIARLLASLSHAYRHQLSANDDALSEIWETESVKKEARRFFERIRTQQEIANEQQKFEAVLKKLMTKPLKEQK